MALPVRARTSRVRAITAKGDGTKIRVPTLNLGEYRSQIQTYRPPAVLQHLPVDYTFAQQFTQAAGRRTTEWIHWPMILPSLPVVLSN